MLCSSVAAQAADASDNNADAEVPTIGWDIRLQEFFGTRTEARAPFTIYARTIAGQWQSAVGSSKFTINGKQRRAYNGSWQHVDMSQAHIVDGAMKGQITIHMTPDLWIPVNGKSFPIKIDVDAKLNDKGALEGTYLAHHPGVDEPTIANFKFGEPGRFTSRNNPEAALQLATEGTLKFDFHSTIVGGQPGYDLRCMVVYVGYRFNDAGQPEVIHASFGSKPRKGDISGRTDLDLSDVTISRLERGFCPLAAYPDLGTSTWNPVSTTSLPVALFTAAWQLVCIRSASNKTVARPLPSKAHLTAAEWVE